MSGLIAIGCGDGEAKVRAPGAEMVSWKAGGKELLWSADPAIWGRTSPVLFPVVGRLSGGRLSAGGRSYVMGVHGFAASSRFEVADRAPDFVRLRLVQDDATLAAFPFAFVLEIEYRLTAEALAVFFLVANPGAVDLPYALGLHPGFVWPLSGASRDGHRIEFERAERPDVPVITKAGLFSAERRLLPADGRILPLSDTLMAHEALCFLDAGSRSLRYVAPDGAAIRMTVEDFPHFALWSRPQAPFLCIEAWTGHGDPDGFAGDVFDKPSMRVLSPGASARHAVRLSYEAAA